MRALAGELNIPLILYEAGEALRFDYTAIEAGINGVSNVLKMLRMVKGRRTRKRVKPVWAQKSAWVRSESDGLIIKLADLGQTVSRGQIIAQIAPPHGGQGSDVKASVSGIVIGVSNIPVTNEGEALFHIACFDSNEAPLATEMVDIFVEAYPNQPSPLND